MEVVDADDCVAYKGIEVAKSVPPHIDLAHLVCDDMQPIEKRGRLTEAELLALARDNVQLTLNELWKQPSKRVEDAVVVQLPPTTLVLPREKPIPKDKGLTKWQQYAKDKGIQKRNKSKLEWDDVTQSWKPRWGYRSTKNDKANDWVVEVPENGDPYKDYFGAKSDAKRERVAKNEMQRVRNVQRGVPKGVLPQGLGMSDEHKTAQQVSRQLARAKQATASLGKHQKTLRDETEPKNKGVRRKFVPNEVSITDEKQKQLRLLDSLAKKKPRIDVTKALAQEHESTSGSGAPVQESGKTAPKHNSKVGRSHTKNKRQKFNEQRHKVGGPGAAALAKGKKPKKNVAISKKTKHTMKTKGFSRNKT